MHFADVQGKCTVVYSEDLSTSLEEYFRGGPDRFYFTEAYNPESREFEEPPTKARAISGKGKVCKILHNSPWW